ncbi:hypothetical protein [Pseudomonas cremoricolorata]|uniref:hypothetical protein n=1 Tax=Pseudomonas cremoricolorata TaxID=157783 RepID=UPI000675E550|nr:hypothetical protein [Pseudomonas cremoricolorata]
MIATRTLPAVLFVAGIGCISLAQPVVAAGNGVIVINRDVQPRAAVRHTGTPDPYPATVSANPSQHVLAQTNELSDGDFASVASGTRFNRVLTPDSHGNLPGMNAGQGQLPGVGGGSAAGASAGNSISNTVNQSVQRGLAPLQILTRGQ